MILRHSKLFEGCIVYLGEEPIWASKGRPPSRRGGYVIKNFTYVSDFMIVENISLVIDPRVSHVVFGKSFVELSDMTYDSSLGVVRLTNGNEEIAYKMPHKIEQYDSLSNDEKENMKSVYLRNDKDKKKGVEYVMSKILGFYKECLELGPEYQTDQDESSSGASENHGGVTYGYIKNHKKTVKNKQTRTRDQKSVQKPEAKARKSQIYSQLQSILVNKSQQDPKYSI
ncbi:hypothetical protein Tco_1312214 [Tanacetum coccineum]